MMFVRPFHAELTNTIGPGSRYRRIWETGRGFLGRGLKRGMGWEVSEGAGRDIRRSIVGWEEEVNFPTQFRYCILGALPPSKCCDFKMRNRAMADIFTAQRLQKFLRKKWKEAGCTLERRQRMGICTAQLTNHSAKRSRRLQDPHFDLWIAVYDEFVSWLVSLVTVAHWNNCKEPYEPTDYEKAIVLLLMRIVSDSLAIRHLMLLGFDAGAKTLVRSTTEHMEVMAAILDDPTMGIEFCKSRDEITANKFWKAYLSKHKVRPRIKNIWLKFFRGEHDAAKFFANWGSNDYPQLSAIAHPSFMGCVHAVIPAKASYSDEKWLGMWGDKSLASIGTVQTCLSP